MSKYIGKKICHMFDEELVYVVVKKHPRRRGFVLARRSDGEMYAIPTASLSNYRVIK